MTKVNWDPVDKRIVDDWFRNNGFKITMMRWFDSRHYEYSAFNHSIYWMMKRWWRSKHTKNLLKCNHIWVDVELENKLIVEQCINCKIFNDD